jgi:hypothetical protein
VVKRVNDSLAALAASIYNAFNPMRLPITPVSSHVGCHESRQHA